MPGDSFLTPGQAAQCLRDGSIVAYPTEAVYGLGCDPFNELALRRILELKNRPVDAGLILIADDFSRFESFIGPVKEAQLAVAMESWPGPVTWLFPRGPAVSNLLAGTHETIALRLTAHPVCRELCALFGGAVVSTSANPSSCEPAQSPGQVLEYFGSELCGIVKGDLGGIDRPSEIRDLATGQVLREG